MNPAQAIKSRSLSGCESRSSDESHSRSRSRNESRCRVTQTTRRAVESSTTVFELGLVKQSSSKLCSSSTRELDKLNSSSPLTSRAVAPLHVTGNVQHVPYHALPGVIRFEISAAEPLDTILARPSRRVGHRPRVCFSSSPAVCSSRFYPYLRDVLHETRDVPYNISTPSN
ncbi:hypothetical protein M5K25_019997 [Dendrobium thyrsiflorum]|uniref:Uncharacterized protein n=1 Tax=Dendrobium thyrsiflorum TaxID=117978 RepID=A0ABD0U8P6_DENTH